jgi:hypothetical protein
MNFEDDEEHVIHMPVDFGKINEILNSSKFVSKVSELPSYYGSPKSGLNDTKLGINVPMMKIDS